MSEFDSPVYIVLVICNSTVERLETWSSYNEALLRGLELAESKASDQSWVNKNPTVKQLSNTTSSVGVFLDTSKYFVGVYKSFPSDNDGGYMAGPIKKSCVGEYIVDPITGTFMRGLPGQTGAFGYAGVSGATGPQVNSSDTSQQKSCIVGCTGPIGPTNVVLDVWRSNNVTDYVKDTDTFKPFIEAAKPDLPGGFDLDNKAILMADIIRDPYNVKKASELSEAQKWAVVTARIQKSNVHQTIIGPCLFHKQSAYYEVKNKTYLGIQIRDIELKYIDNIISNLCEDED